MGYDDKALAHFRIVTEMEPDLAEAHYEVGLGLEKREEYDEAARSFEKAVNLVGDEPDYYFHLGLAYRQLRRFAEAATAFRSVLRFQPTNAEVLKQLATMGVAGLFDRSGRASRR
jgi:tetratricopeptide (TPR) repeat protein